MALPEPEVVIVIEQGTLRCVAAKHAPFVYRLIDLDAEDPPEDYEADTITDDLNAFTKETTGGN